MSQSRSPRRLRNPALHSCLTALVVFASVSLSAQVTAIAPIAPIPPGTTSSSDIAFGDIIVTSEQTGGGNIGHGYSEFRFVVTNISPDQQHTVEIAAPANRFNLAPGSISKLARTVVVAPGTSATVTLFQPALVVSGHNATVTIDGVEEETEVPFAPVYSSRGPGVRILASRATSDTDLRTALEMALGTAGFEIKTADVEASAWSSNWLSYTSYDALVLTKREYDRAGADVKLAIDRFARAGGLLVVLDSLPLADCAGEMAPPEMLSFCARGFGLRVSTMSPITSWLPDDITNLAGEISKSQSPWGASHGVHPTRGPDFRVVEKLSVPIRGLFVAMILFAIAAGPVNLAILSKMDKRIWIFGTLPAIAIGTSVLVIGVATLSEGWVRASRTEAITWLDPATREATTVGWTGFYATVAPSGGLQFGAETELQPFGGGRNNILEIDWTNGQHLNAGWLSSRVTSVFRVRKSEPRRERLTFRYVGNELEVTNGLGAPVEALWVADLSGNVWRGVEIEAGSTAKLDVSKVSVTNANYLRSLYTDDWLTATSRTKATPASMIQPGRWTAVVQGAPFVEDAMPGVRKRNGSTLVMSDLVIGGAE